MQDRLTQTQLRRQSAKHNLMWAVCVLEMSLTLTFNLGNHVNSTWDLLLKALCMRHRVQFYLNVRTLMSEQVNNIKSIDITAMLCSS